MSKTLKKIGAVAVAIAWILCITGTSQARYEKETISWVQQSLQTLGYYEGEVTGTLDDATKGAIKNFQEGHGLKVDGMPGEETKKAIEKALEEKAEEQAEEEQPEEQPEEEQSPEKQ